MYIWFGCRFNYACAGNTRATFCSAPRRSILQKEQARSRPRRVFGAGVSSKALYVCHRSDPSTIFGARIAPSKLSSYFYLGYRACYRRLDFHVLFCRQRFSSPSSNHAHRRRCHFQFGPNIPTGFADGWRISLSQWKFEPSSR